MNKKLLTLSGLGLVLLGVIGGKLLSSFQGMELIIIPLEVIGIILLLTGIVMNLQIHLWLKVLLVVIFTPLVFILFFYLMWGLTTGFTFSI